jgi:hypothetical protein
MTSPLLDLSYEYNRGNSVGTLNGKYANVWRNCRVLKCQTSVLRAWRLFGKRYNSSGSMKFQVCKWRQT